MATGKRTALGRILFSAAVGLSVISATPALSADVVILDSSIAAFEPGSLIAADSVVELPAGASITMIMPSGETRVLAGPYKGDIGADAAAQPSTIQALTGGRGRDTEVLGAVRAPKWEISQ